MGEKVAKLSGKAQVSLLKIVLYDYILIMCIGFT